MPADTLEQIVSLCKRRGFIFPGSSVYGGLANSWDYGPLGVELKNNVKRAWWEANVYDRDDVDGLDAAILMNRKVWKYSGHEATFNDPLVDNKKTGGRCRLDHLLAAQAFEAVEAFAAGFVALFEAAVGGIDEAEAILPAAWANEIPLVSVLRNLVEDQEDEVRAGFITSLIKGIQENDETAVQLVCRLMLSLAKTREADVCKVLATLIDPDTGEAGEWTAPRLFNLMFSTHAGPIESDENKVYLRPETAQGIFVNFNHVQDTMRRKLPFGIAQIGKSFRNEITPGNFTFRTREFEQMEIEYFVKPGEDDASHAEWVARRYQWYLDLGLADDRLRKRAQSEAELAHYAKATVDIEYLFPGSLGYSELEGVANRTDFDLSAHSREVTDEDLTRLKLPKNEDAVETLDYFDQDEKRRYIPYVIEPSAGADRATLAFLCEAFEIEPTKEVPEADKQAIKDLVSSFLKSAEKNENLSRRPSAGQPGRFIWHEV
ncbi:MAG: glycine--tRNA ligase, partial [Planctomycetes bacterium]|nr:glycine--tRNA ligase [Planctomycetota bacterium]